MEKLNYAFASGYPMNWGVKVELANNYKSLGVFMSAHELLKLIGYTEESIRCLFMAGRHGQAIEMAEEYIQGNEIKDYNMLCLMGEMKNDYTYFEKADEISNGKCSKALRMLGRHYFFT